MRLAAPGKRSDKPLSHLLDLPPSQIGNGDEIVYTLGSAPGNILESLPRAKHSRIQLQPRRGSVAHRLETIHLLVEVAILVPALTLRKFRQPRLRDFHPMSNRGDYVGAGALDHSLRHSLDRA